MFGNRLRQARELANMSQGELAKLLGITQSAYSYYENCEKTPSLPVAKRMATILHTSLDYLVGIESETK